MFAKILEAAMILCFGLAWPFALIKSWKDRTAKGKSVVFLASILIGYSAGITKVVITDGWSGWLLIPYGLNFCMVSADALLYIRNKRLDAERQK